MKHTNNTSTLSVCIYNKIIQCPMANRQAKEKWKQQITHEKKEKRNQTQKGKNEDTHTHTYIRTHTEFLRWIPLFTFFVLSSSVFFFNFIYVCGFLGMIIARASNSFSICALIFCSDFITIFLSLHPILTVFYVQNDYSISFSAFKLSFSYFNMDAHSHSHLISCSIFFWFCSLFNMKKETKFILSFSFCCRVRRV